MKNWKKYTVLFMTCCLALCTLASAATNDGTFTGYSNRQGYTPRSADILLTSRIQVAAVHQNTGKAS